MMNPALVMDLSQGHIIPGLTDELSCTGPRAPRRPCSITAHRFMHFQEDIQNSRTSAGITRSQSQRFPITHSPGRAQRRKTAYSGASTGPDSAMSHLLLSPSASPERGFIGRSRWPTTSDSMQNTRSRSATMPSSAGRTANVRRWDGKTRTTGAWDGLRRVSSLTVYRSRSEG